MKRQLSQGLALAWLLVSCQEQPVTEKEPHKEGSEPLQSQSADSWETEEFTQAISQRLEQWKYYLKGEVVDGLVGQSSSLIGENLERVGQSGAFSVRRATDFDSQLISLVEALSLLRDSFGDEVIKLAEIKTVHVELDAQGAKTRHLVHLASQSKQINAEWLAQWKRTQDPELEVLQIESFEEVDGAPQRRFMESTKQVLGSEDEQIHRSLDHWLARIEMKFGIDISGSHGVSVADLNGDGLDDLFFPDAGGLPNRLFLQKDDGSLKDFTTESKLNYLDHTYSALFVDLDNDGDQDAILAMSRGLLCLENDGIAQFKVRSVEAFPQAVPYSLSVADYDQDGDIDIYVNCYTKRFGVLATKDVLARPVPYHDAVNGGRNELLQNEGGFRFRLVTKQAGLGEQNYKFSYSSSWEDYDLDGDLDLYIANDFGRNYFFENQLVPSGRPVFHEKAAEVGIEDIAAGMSTSWGDFNNDGRADLYVGNMFSSAGNRIAFQERFKPKSGELKELYQRHARGNSLFQNLGGGRFEDVPGAAGASMGRWSWSSLFTDFDNDGWEDILVANGFVTQKDPDDL